MFHKQPLPSGYTLRLWWFKDHKFLSTVVYLLLKLQLDESIHCVCDTFSVAHKLPIALKGYIYLQL